MMETHMPDSATIKVNGQPEPLGATTIAGLLAAKEMADARGIAVALNGEVVPRDAWQETELCPGDAVEIVRAFQGG
jgi:sulfur carrier protein